MINSFLRTSRAAAPRSALAATLAAGGIAVLLLPTGAAAQQRAKPAPAAAAAASPGQGQAMNFTFGASKFEGELAPKVEHSSEKKPTAPQGTSSFKPSGQLTVVSSAPKNFQDSRTLNINRFLERKPPKLSPVRREEGASSEKQPTPASSKRPSSFIAGLKPEVLASRRNHPTESH